MSFNRKRASPPFSTHDTSGMSKPSVRFQSQTRLTSIFHAVNVYRTIVCFNVSIANAPHLHFPPRPASHGFGSQFRALFARQEKNVSFVEENFLSMQKYT